MTWFRVDDKLHDHRKVRRLAARDRLPALGLWSACGSWSADTLSDGFVPDEIVRRFDSRQHLAKALVDVGLWHREERDGEPGYVFHQWAEHQPTGDEVRAAREKQSKSGALGNHRRWHTNNPSPTCRYCPDRVPDRLPDRKPDQYSDRETIGSSESVPTPPARPDPIKTTTYAPRKRDATKRGTRIPDDFTVTKPMIDWATENTPAIDTTHETAKFADYWNAESGARASKRDWTAAWRTWMRNAAERTPTTNGKVRPIASSRSWTPPEPPAHIADNPTAYRTWYADQVAQHRRSQA